MCRFTYAIFACVAISLANCNNDDPSAPSLSDLLTPALSDPLTPTLNDPPAPNDQLTPFLDDPCADNRTFFVEVGQTLFHCLNNTRQIFGCKFDETIMADGDTLIRDHYLLQCQTNEARDATRMVKIACHVDNHILGPGQTYVDGHEFYTCTWNNLTGDLVYEKSGCVDDLQRKVKVSETLVHGRHEYRCKAVSRDDPPGPVIFQLVRDGCAYDNYPYKAGQIMLIGDYWYTCEKSDHNNQVDYFIKPRGCIVDFGFLDLGEIFHKKGYIYKCEETAPATHGAHPEVRRTVIGCLEVTPKKTILEHYPGEQWVESQGQGQNQAKYIVQCGVDQKTGHVTKTTSQCYLDTINGERLGEALTLKPGCMARTHKSLWKCGKTNDGKISSTILENAGLEETVRALLSGFAFC